MAITVEVRGSSGSSGGGNNFNQPSQTPSSGNNGYQRIDINQYKPGDGSSSVMPSSNRIAEDIRREIQQRGIVMVPGTQNFSTMMNQMRQQQAQIISNSIGSNYNKGISTIDDMRDKAHADVADRIFNATQSALQGITNPVNIRNIQKKYSRIEEREHDRIDDFFQPFYERANQEKVSAEKTSEDELTKAIQQLTQEFQRGNEGSYVNGLRNQYREAIWKRDNAGTKEEAEQFAKEAAEAQKRLGDISNKGSGENFAMTLLRGGAGMSLAYTAMDNVVKLRNMQFQNRMTDQNLISQTANGNVFGAIQADAERNLQNKQTIASIVGSVIGGTAGFFLGGGLPGAAAGAMGGSYAGSKIADLMGVFSDDKETIAQAQLGQILQSNEQKIMGYNSLAMMTRGGGSIDARRQSLIDATYKASKPTIAATMNGQQVEVDGMTGERAPVSAAEANILAGTTSIWGANSAFSLYDLGYTAPEFAQMAAQRIAARGFGATNADAAIQRAFNADAMEKVFSLGNGSLNNLAQWDRYRGTDYTQTFANLAATMNGLGTRGFSNGDYGRAGEFIGYQNQLMQSQFNQGILNPSTNYATGTLATLQNVFGNSLNSQAISSYNRMQSSIKNPNGDMARMILYDVIKERFHTGNNLAAIRRIQYSQDGAVQDEVQRLFNERLMKTYGGTDTTSGMLNIGGIFGEENPFMLDKLIAAGKKGASKVTQGSVGGYAEQAKGWASPITQSVNKISDAAMSQTAAYQDNMTDMINLMINKFSQKLDDIISKLGN